MKKILIFAAIVISLIAIIKIGSPVLTASIGGGPPTKATEEAPTPTPTTPQKETEKLITIDIENETDETPPETAEASAEADQESQAAGGQSSTTTTETAVASTTAAVVYAVKPIDKTMYAVKAVNVRESYSTDSAIVSSLKAGQEVHATGESDNGWIRVDYTGKTAYVYKTYLSTNKADIETKPATTTKPTTTTKPATTKPAPTQPASPTPTQPASPTPTQPASPTPTQPAPSPGTPGGDTTETIAPFPG